LLLNVFIIVVIIVVIIIITIIIYLFRYRLSPEAFGYTLVHVATLETEC